MTQTREKFAEAGNPLQGLLESPRRPRKPKMSNPDTEQACEEEQDVKACFE